MLILLHTSKTMRTTMPAKDVPVLADRATQLVSAVRALSIAEIMKIMQVSEALAVKTKEQFAMWTPGLGGSSAIEAFVGDIYSGLRAQSLTTEDRHYAQQHLRILSGLYGVLSPNDAIHPYRLEMGYKIAGEGYKNLYEFWGDAIAKALPSEQHIVDLTAGEYSKAVLPYLTGRNVVAPRFLTVSPASEEPVFVVVHAKIARGAFARWMIQKRATKISQLKDFDELGYSFDAALSTSREPVFVCREFGGKGLSVRLTKN